MTSFDPGYRDPRKYSRVKTALFIHCKMTIINGTFKCKWILEIFYTAFSILFNENQDTASRTCRQMKFFVIF